jgi:type I restriction enzyme S subunit
MLEQSRISTFFETVDSLARNLKEQKENLERYKKGLMQKIFSQEVRFKDNNGKDFQRWEEKKLGELVESYNGLTNKTAGDFGIGKPFVTYKQIFDSNEINILKFALVNVCDHENQNKVKYGDILFTTSSETPHEVAFSSVLLSETASPYLNSFSFGVRPKSFDDLHPNYSVVQVRNAK